MNAASMLVDLRYAMGQLKRLQGLADCHNEVGRAIDALDRVECELAGPEDDASERCEVVPGWTVQEILDREC